MSMYYYYFYLWFFFVCFIQVLVHRAFNATEMPLFIAPESDCLKNVRMRKKCFATNVTAIAIGIIVDGQFKWTAGQANWC